jgi:tetratricopeptide (TPR) repeat protein
MRAALVICLLLQSAGTAAKAEARAMTEVTVQGRSDINDDVARGAGLIAIGHYEEAIAVFDDILARTPDFGPALANRALAYAWTNRLVEATHDLDAAARTMPDDAIIHRVRAFIAQRRSDDRTALAEFSRSLEQEPGNQLALRFRAYIHQRAGNHAAALADADTYIDSHPEDPDGYVLKADLLIDQREPSLAETEAGRLIRLFPEDAYSLAAAARIYHALANRDRALAAINEAITRSPDLFYYRLLRAGFRRWDDFAGRRADLAAALALDPGNGDVTTELGLLDFKERKWSDAITRFSTVIALEPRDFGLLAYRAMAYLNAGERVLAERDFRTALAAASGADDFSLICGEFARRGMALEWGMEACNRAVSLNANESPYRANRGLIALRLGRLSAALADYNAAVEADGRRADGYYGRALVFHRQGARQAAAADRARALSIDPGIAEAYQEYGFADF